MNFLIVFLASLALCHGDFFQPPLSHDQYGTRVTRGSPNPYSFEYRTGRFPEYVDRVHSEIYDDSGYAQGRYSYSDPSSKVRTFQYTAGGNGHNPFFTNYDHGSKAPDGYEAVRNAKEMHLDRYNNIAAYDAQTAMDSPSIARRKKLHHYLYNQISLQHAAIGNQRAAGYSG